MAKAEGDAKSTVTRAQGEADASRIRQTSMTPQLLELRRLENQRAYNDECNGQLPGVEPEQRFYPASLDRTSSADRPVTRMTLLRLVWPEAIETAERCTANSLAKNSMQASLARPLMGGAVRATFKASPSSPVMEFFLARGRTLIAKVTQFADS